MQRMSAYNTLAIPDTGLPIGGFPSQKVVKLKYVTEQNISVSTGLSKSVSYIANGMFDPEAALGGHQPKMFDQWMAVYSHYNVVASKISVRLAISSNPQLTWGVARTATTDQLTGLTLPTILENRYQGDWTINGDSNPNNVTMANRTMTANYNQKVQFGLNATGRDDLNGSAIINPHEQSVFELWVCPILGNTGNINATFVVEIEFVALLTEPRLVGTS